MEQPNTSHSHRRSSNVPTLDQTISNAARAPQQQPKHTDGETKPVDIDLLDENPFQPRVSMNASELDELASSILTQGLLQAIVVRPKPDGRFVIVAGHRRHAAFRKLRDAATAETRHRFARINATVRLALDDAQLASMAYSENVSRSGLTAVEEGRALERMVDAGLAKTNEELAALTSQSLQKIRRLRRVAKAPKIIKDAVETGIMVPVSSAEGAPEERRRLDLMAALQFVALFEHFQKSRPQKADERIAATLRRALTQNWSLRRTEEFVKSAQEGRETAEAVTANPRSTVFERSERRFVVNLTQLAHSTPEQRTELRAAFESLFEGNQQ
ncbi:MAG: ParB/RepB/Spo0J family partition protein [Archangium sp.]